MLETANGLPEVAFHFYGRVDSGFKQRFGAGQFGLPNVEYHGVFDSVPGDVRAKLSRYDLPLLPASSPNEGVPEVLVETKIAAVPPIASDCCHNAEIVKDKIDGIVLEKCAARNLSPAIAVSTRMANRLDETKRAPVSAERFYIDCYVDLIASELAA